MINDFNMLINGAHLYCKGEIPPLLQPFNPLNMKTKDSVVNSTSPTLTLVTQQDKLDTQVWF